MTLYSIALFLHIVGAVVLFVLLTVEGLRQGTKGARLNRIFGPISALLILVPGLYARVGMAVAVVFVMTVKPDVLVSSITVAVGLVAGLAGGLFTARQVQST